MAVFHRDGPSNSLFISLWREASLLEWVCEWHALMCVLVSVYCTDLHGDVFLSLMGVCKWAGYGGISGANLAASLQRQIGRRGTLEVYVSPGLAVTRIIGPVTDLAVGWARDGDACDTGPKRARRGSGCVAVALRAVERGTAVAFHLDVVKPLETQAYVQVGALAAMVALAWRHSWEKGSAVRAD